MSSSFNPLPPKAAFETPTQTIGYSNSGVMIISNTELSFITDPIVAAGHSHCFSSINLLSGSYHCMRKIPDGDRPHRYLYPLYGFRITQHCEHPFVSGTFVVSANFLGTSFSGILCMCMCRVKRLVVCLE